MLTATAFDFLFPLVLLGGMLPGLASAAANVGAVDPLDASFASDPPIPIVYHLHSKYDRRKGSIGNEGNNRKRHYRGLRKLKKSGSGSGSSEEWNKGPSASPSKNFSQDEATASKSSSLKSCKSSRASKKLKNNHYVDCPTQEPSVSMEPSGAPSISLAPSLSIAPSMVPTTSDQPSISSSPSLAPSGSPSSTPSAQPTLSASPSGSPSSTPSAQPTLSAFPSASPSSTPSAFPSTFPTTAPSEVPSLSLIPSNSPSGQPSFAPSVSAAPSCIPRAENCRTWTSYDDGEIEAFCDSFCPGEKCCSTDGGLTVDVDNACSDFGALDGLTLCRGSCQGTSSCRIIGYFSGITTASIGEFSCQGEGSCLNMGRFGDGANAVSFTIGDNSCVGNRACTALSFTPQEFDVVATLGDGSCVGEDACYIFGVWSPEISVGDGSCVGDYSCKDLASSRVNSNVLLDPPFDERRTITIGNNACVGDSGDGSTEVCQQCYSGLERDLVIADGAFCPVLDPLVLVINREDGSEGAGNCSVTDGGSCLESHPGVSSGEEYGNGQFCAWTVTQTGTLSVEVFDTNNMDPFQTVTGLATLSLATDVYSGDTVEDGPNNVPVVNGDRIEWTSDDTLDVGFSGGFRICLILD